MLNKKINRLYIVFLIIGIIITSIGLYTSVIMLDNSNKVDTIGTITSIVSTSNVLLMYTLLIMLMVKDILQ